jgi:TolB-like protein/class 3 adenylate cyclase/Tfp pilus assembly protein PilF
MPQYTRQLAAILFTDIVGYTGMMQQNEENALLIMSRYTSVLNKLITDHGGKILNDYGDGNLCSFSSATQAVQCALCVQQLLQTDLKVPLRIGLHVGEIIFEGEKVMGDGVNVASRIQSLGLANSILFSKEVFDKIKNQPEFNTICLGFFEFKSVEEPMEVFALTNQGLKVPKREEMSGKLKEIKQKSTRRKWMILTAMVVLLVAGLFFYKARMHNAVFTGTERSIAVLPFENIGSDKSEEYISDGITQDVISSLSKISSLQKVIGWISVKSFKKTSKSIKEIADELDVAAILSGTIEKEDQKTRIRAELTEVGTSKLLWVENFEYAGNDFLSIQSKLAIQIANALKANLSPEEKKGITRNYTDNAEAYKLYRRGRIFWDIRNKANYDSAQLYFNKAVQLDPDYALAYSGLADCYTFNQKGLTQMEAIPIAKEYARKALSLDSNLTEAKTALAFIQGYFDFDLKGAMSVFNKIISENPNYAPAHIYLGNLLGCIGEHEADLNEKRKALSIDPLSAAWNMVLGRTFYNARKYDSAFEQLQKTILLNPRINGAYNMLGLIFIQKKEYQKALDVFSKLPPGPFDVGNNGLVYFSYTYALKGDKMKAMEYLNKIQGADRLQCAYFLAYVYLALGDTNEALNQLEYSYANHFLTTFGMNIDPNLDPIRKEPRYQALLKKIYYN